MTTVLQNPPALDCKYSEITIDRAAGTVAKRVLAWLDQGVFEREIYWLRKLCDLVFVPDLVSFDNNTKTIVTSYRGERLRRDNLPADWERQVRAIILALRARGCAHNDIKPSELLVLDGFVSLCDFAWASEYGSPLPDHWPPALGEEFALEPGSSHNDAFAIMKSICHVLEHGEYFDAGGRARLEGAGSGVPAVAAVEDGEASLSFCDTPNMFAGELEFTETDHEVIAKGYQCYEITATGIQALGGNFTSPKSQALLSYLQPDTLAGKTVNDLGCANGFFSFAAMFAGADRVSAVDMDEEHLTQVQRVVSRFGFDRVEPILSNVQEYSSPADLTICLALIHWIYSCTTFFGRFTRCFEHLSSLTDETLIIEWVDPRDAAILHFGHLRYNEHLDREEYCRENFLAALYREFPRRVAELPVSDTRVVYIAEK